MSEYVLVEDQEDNKLSSGIVVAQEKDKQSQIGKVIDLETFNNEEINLLLKAGIKITLQDLKELTKQNQIKKDSLVIYKKYSGNQVELEGKKYKLIAFSDIIGIIKEENGKRKD